MGPPRSDLQSAGPTSDQARPIVVFGDSYTCGTGVPATETFPAHLADLLDQEVLERGVHGETAAEALSRFQADVLDAAPGLVVLEFGVNEAFRGQPVEACTEALGTMLRKLEDAGIPRVLVGVHHAGFQRTFDQALARLARRYQAGLVTGALDGVLEDPALRVDEHHPNGQGYELMAKRVAPTICKMLS